jgi:hypothetical protein
MTEITQWRDPASRRGIHQFVPGLPEPVRTTRISRTSTSAGDVKGSALEDWLDGLTVTSTVDAD